MPRCLFLLLIVPFLFITTLLPAQQIEQLTSGTKISIRGLSVVNDLVVWVSGNNGTVGRSLDGGKTWQWVTVKGFEKRDFRDIEAFNSNTAVIIAIAEPGQILRTTDGGQHWQVVYTDSTKGMFLDAMDFYDRQHGIVVGDPINSKFYVAKTTNGGVTWRQIPPVMQSKSAEGEGCFASSGTNIHYFRNKDFLFVSGGLQSRLHDDSGGRFFPIIQGKASTGANSIAVRNKHMRVSDHFIVVGGDFSKDKDTTGNCIITRDAGQTWIRPATPPGGYRSCVIYLNNKTLLTCGTSGIDWSKDGGMNWQPISKEGFHVCQKAKSGKAVFLAGGGGRIAKLIY